MDEIVKTDIVIENVVSQRFDIRLVFCHFTALPD